MNRKDFEDFMYGVINKINRDQICRKPKEVSWDKHLRAYFYDIAISAFCKKFKVYDEETRRYIYAEGQGEKGKSRIPLEYRKIRFMDSPMIKAPDAAFIDEKSGFAVAIELDHGTKGSQLLNALSKAGMNVLLAKKIDKALLLFIDEGGKLKEYEKDENYIRIRDWFKEKLSTEVFII